MISKRASLVLVSVLTAAVAAIFLALPRIPQPLSYHSFADQRTFWGVPNFANVLSNLPFAVFGIWGLFFLLRAGTAQNRAHFHDPRERWPYLFVFLGLLLTAFGSSYYHLDPSNARLVWDRLPMTIAFMSVVAALIAERLSLRLGLWLLPLLMLVGLSSVLQWYASELRGAGDLRFYASVQIYAALFLLTALLFPGLYTRTADLAAVAGLYVLAKILESLDKPIFAAGHIISGHTLKHLAAAAADYCILFMLVKRHPVSTHPPSLAVDPRLTNSLPPQNQ